MNTIVTALLAAFLIGAILLTIMFVIFGGTEYIANRFPKVGKFFENMFNDEK